MSNFFFKSKTRDGEDQIKRILFPIGCLFDVPTAMFRRGEKGETVMVAGLGPMFGMLGGPNSFKSTILHTVMLRALGRVSESGMHSFLDLFDTEGTLVPERLSFFAESILGFEGVDIFIDELVQLTDMTLLSSDDWFKKLEKWIEENKYKQGNKAKIKLPFFNEKDEQESIYFPTFGEIDSFSEMITEGAEDIEDTTTVSDAKGNMLFMRDGLGKTKFMMRLGRLCNKGDHYVGMSAHMGEKFEIPAGPTAPKPTKDIPHFKTNEKVKGVPKKFLYLPHLILKTRNVKPLINQGTRYDEYPKNQKEDMQVAGDLIEVTVDCVRNKTGQSGFALDYIVSQSEGLLVSLSEFHALRVNGQFGLENRGANWHCKLLPDVKFMRTTIREELRNNPKLERALNICLELMQMKIFHRHLYDVPDIDDLYRRLEDEYGWDTLLETRGYWTLNQYDHPLPYLSCADIVNMYHGTYKPFWWKGKKKESKEVKGEKDA